MPHHETHGQHETHGMGFGELRTGSEVYCSDNRKLGEIADVQTDYVHITKGFLFSTDLYIPRDAISDVRDGKVYLNVPCDAVEGQHWDTPPTRGTRLGL